MADDLDRKGPRDAARVDVDQDWERRYWCDKFGCSEPQLREAVDKVGVMSKDVEAYLRKGRDARAA